MDRLKTTLKKDDYNIVSGFAWIAGFVMYGIIFQWDPPFRGPGSVVRM